MQQIWKPFVRPAIYQFQKFLIGAVFVWIGLESLMGVWLYSTPEEPAELSRLGLLQLFSIVFSIFYVPGVAFTFIVLVAKRSKNRRQAGDDKVRGFEVIRPENRGT